SPIDVTRNGAAALRNPPKRDDDHGCGERKINEECPAPGGVLDQPSAENRPNRGCDGGKTRPGADRLAASFLVEGRTDDCEAAGDEQRSAHTLNTSRDDQL